MNKKYELIVLDVDGTIVADYNSHDLLPDVLPRLAEFDDCEFALASNQGGVGLRHWMELGGFGEPEKYPEQVAAARRIKNIANRIMLRLDCWCYYYVAFAYQSKKGEWAPTPDGWEHDVRWRHDWRKPGPGMIQHAMFDTQIDASRVLMVGDREEDEAAAVAAGVDFMWAYEFFGREAVC